MKLLFYTIQKMGLALGFVLLNNCSTPKISYLSESLEISQLTDHTFIHKSFLSTQSFGKVSCNGLIYLNDSQAVIFDTPTTDSVSAELINWVEQKMNHKIKAVIVSHWHPDCLGGLGTFHKKNIPSIANDLTIQLAKDSITNIPKTGFAHQVITNAGQQDIQSEYFGEGHTQDNIVSYIKSEGVLFGGCLIKAMNASEGYVDDGNVEQWSKTVQSIKGSFEDIRYVVPGHGKSGGVELLDYTIDLFDKYKK